MRILLSGICGHMGREVEALAGKGYRGAELVAGVDMVSSERASVPYSSSFDEAETNVDCIIDFSHHSCTNALLDFAVCNKLPLVLATTGQNDEEREAIRRASERIPLFFAANYSLGVALLIELAKKTVATLPGAEIEIIEKHHNRKLDSPSGTALAIANALRSVRPSLFIHSGRTGMGKREPDEIGIHSIRMGNIVGEHEVIVSTGTQTIALKHEAHSRALFAEGALVAADFLVGKPAGLYDMQSIIKMNEQTI